MTNDEQKPSMTPDQLEELFELIRSRNTDAFSLFKTLFHARINRRFSRTGIHFIEWDDLFQEVAMSIWLSAARLSCPSQLQSHVVRETQKAIKRFVKSHTGSEDRLSLLNELEALIHCLRVPSTPEIRKDIMSQVMPVLEKLRRIS